MSTQTVKKGRTREQRELRKGRELAERDEEEEERI